MLMMRLQRVGRKNDPSFRIVVCDKRTGPKSNKNIDILGSYNPKMDHVQVDTEKAKEWLSKGVQPSDTVHNILVGQKVIEAKKKNVLPKKSPIVDEEALAKEAEAKAAAEAAEQTESDAPVEEAEAPEASTEEAPAAEETPKATEEPKAEDAPVEELKEETPEGDEAKKAE
mgnify:FL=1